MREAMHYQKLPEGKVQCLLCPHNCIISKCRSGLCRSRENLDGILFATNYAQSVAFSLDPIEKKPLYHFHPGSEILSLGPNSCNLSCFFCQNHSISQTKAGTKQIEPKQLLDHVIANSLKQVAFTYTEPLTWYEFIYDFALLSQAHQIDLVLVTNGYLNPKPLKQILPYISAMNIDLKSSDDGFYQKHCGASLEPVLTYIRVAYEAGVHLELTTLLIPNLNTADETIAAIIDFVAGIDSNIPLHFSKYHPAFKASYAPTDVSVINHACQMAKERLHHVYAGNVYLPDYTDTLCPTCGRILVQRRNYHIITYITNSEPALCPQCKIPIYGKFDN